MEGTKMATKWSYLWETERAQLALKRRRLAALGTQCVHLKNYISQHPLQLREDDEIIRGSHWVGLPGKLFRGNWLNLPTCYFLLPSIWNTNKIARAAAAIFDHEVTLRKEAICQGWWNRKEEVTDEFVDVPGLSLDIFKNKFIYLFILLFGCVGPSLLHAWLSLVVAGRSYSSLWCAGFSLQWLLLLWSMGSRRAGFSSCGSWALEHRLSSCGTRA